MSIEPEYLSQILVRMRLGFRVCDGASVTRAVPHSSLKFEGSGYGVVALGSEGFHLTPHTMF